MLNKQQILELRDDISEVHAQHQLIVNLFFGMIKAIDGNMMKTWAESRQYADALIRQIAEVDAKHQQKTREQERRVAMAKRIANNVNTKIPDAFYTMAFIYRVALHDAFIDDLIKMYLVNFPDAMKSGKKLTYEEIIDGVQQVNLLETIADKEVREFSFKSVTDQARWLEERFGVSLVCMPKEQAAEWMSKLVELNARRNLLVHSGGVINKRYVEETGSTMHVGTTLTINMDYYKAAHALLLMVADGLDGQLKRKFLTV
jgi:hypothetical protein